MNKTSSAIVRTLLLGTSCLCAVGMLPAKADPTGGVVIGGSATITSNGVTTVINQTTNKAVINWDSFSIAAGGTVRFDQPGVNSFTLNRVVGSAPSTIYGNLLANGNVWLINGNGIMFGKGSQINVGSLIATTSDIDNQDFLNGSYVFKTGTGAAVVNQGTIKTRNGGSVVLSGSRVENQGLIVANTGTVVLGGASAFTVDFNGDGLLKYQITQPAQQPDSGKPGVTNSGTIKAAGGQVVMTARAAQAVTDAVVNNTGMISATSAKVDQNGTVILDGGDGDVNVGGTIDVSGKGSGETGGTVTVTGRNVAVADGTTIDASGSAGGGTVKIGGGLHGDGSVAPAANVTVGAATIKADATKKGDGGTVVVWSGGRTDVGAAISARGGSEGGNGGTVETSGHSLNVRSTTTVDTRAPKGATGTWLLDPDTIYVSNYGDGNTGLNGDGTLGLGTDSGETDYVSPDTIIAALNTTNVQLEASNLIEVDSPIVFASSHSLSMLSEGSINIYASIQNTQASGGGAINLIAGWDGTTAIENLATTANAFGNNEGEVYLGGEGNDIYVGSASGRLFVAGAYVTLDAEYGVNVQLGYHGAGGGDITVLATNDVTLLGENPYYGSHAAMIGNGSFDGTAAGVATGDVYVRAGGSLYLLGGGEDCIECGYNVPRGGTSVAQEGPADNVWIGNRSGIGDAPSTGNVTLIAGDIHTDDGYGFNNMLVSDLYGGNVTVGVTNSEYGLQLYNNLNFDSSHTLSFLSTSSIGIYGSIQNEGSGDINLVAGWDGVTLDAAHFGDAGVFGHDGGSILIGGYESFGDVSVGTAHGTLNVFGQNITASAYYGNVQLGFHGNGTGDINVKATGYLALTALDIPGYQYSAMIGNGALDGSVSGTVSGNIDVRAGTLVLAVDNGEGCDCAQVQHGAGNETPASFLGIGNQGGVTSGNVTIVAGSIYEPAYGVLGGIIAHDIVYGDFTLGLTGGDALRIDSQLDFDSDHTLSLLSTGDVEIAGSVQNSGTGAINVVAGWDGITLDAAHFGGEGVFGNSGAYVYVGGPTAGNDSIIGTASGELNIFTGSLVVQGKYAAAQVGYHGAGGGNINVTATGSIYVDNGSYRSVIGNGGTDIAGNVTGDINLFAGDTTFIDSSVGSMGWLGNRTASGFRETGDLTVLTHSGFFYANVIKGALGTSATTGGDVFIGFYDPSPAPLSIGGLNYTSAHSLTFASAGNLQVTGSIQNSGSGAVTLVAGWDGHTVGSAADLLAAGAYGLSGGTLYIGGNHTYTVGESSTEIDQNQNAAVGSASGTTTLLGGEIDIVSANGFYTQVGYHGAGSGNINIVALDDLNLSGGASAAAFAMIGNGGLNGDVGATVSGDITVNVGGTTTISVGEGQSNAWIGNYSTGTFSGAVTLLTGYLDADNVFWSNVGTDLTGGDVTVGITASDANALIGGPIDYSSTHTLNLLSAGNLLLYGSIQNSGSGTLNIVAGWDGSTLDAAHFGDNGVFGNNGGNLYLRGEGAVASVAVGSAGATHIFANDVTLFAGTDAYAQIGYRGGEGGPITIVALGDVILNGGETEDESAWIGNGTEFGTHTAGGDVSITAGAIGGYGVHAVTGDALVLETTAGAIGDSNYLLHFSAGTLQVTTAGGGAYLSSPDGGITLDGVDLSGGDFWLSAGGAVDQSAALATGDLHIDTTSGNITLTDEGNAFGAATIVTPGNASLTHQSLLTIAYANVGGTLTLHAGTSINQSGGIIADTLDATADAGTIELTNPYNDFATLAVHTSGSYGARFIDANDVDLEESSVGGLFFLATGGSITQSGSLTADGISIASTHGNITLTNSANSLGDIRVTTPGNASLTDAGAMTISYAYVSQILTLDAGGAISQLDGEGSTGILAGTLDATANGGAIVLDNAANDVGTLKLHTDDGYAASFTDATGVVLGDTAIGGLFTLSAGGTITQSGTLTSDGLTISNSQGSITLDNANNSFGAIDVTTTGSATFVSAGSITIASADVDDTLTLQATTSVSQTGAISAGGLVASAGDGTIVLTDSGNAFAALTLTTSGSNDATIVDSTGVAFGASDVGGTLTLTAGGAVTQTGAVSAATLDVTANGGGIELSNAANSFASLTLHTGEGYGASVTDAAGVDLGASAVGGLFVLDAGGAITQSGALTSNGLAVSTTSGDITLTNSGNSLGIITVSTPGNAALTDAGAMTVAYADVGQTLTLHAGSSISDVQPAGALAETGPETGIHAATLNATADGGTISLLSEANEIGTLSVHTTGSYDASVVDSTAVTVAASSVGGQFTLSAGGAIGQSGAIASNGLDISTTAGDITLTNAANSLGPIQASTPDSAAFTEAASVVIAGADVGGTLALHSGTSISQTGGIFAATVNATADDGTIILTDAKNAFGAVSLHTTGSNGASVVDTSALVVGASNIGGTLTLSTGGAISQSGAIVAAALDATTSSGAITLTDAGNSFAALAVHTTGSDGASVTDATGVSLGASSVGGLFTLETGGAIGQSGALTSNGLVVATSTGDITLTNAGNSLGTVTVSTPGNASLTEAAAIMIARADVGQTLTLLADTSISQTGTVSAGGLGEALPTSGISAATLNATANGGTIVLTNSANEIGTLSVHTTGSYDASVVDSTVVTVAASSVGGKFTLSAGGAIGQSGAIASNGLNVSTSAGDITLTNAANSLGPIQVSTPDNAAFTEAASVVIAGADVGSTLTLHAGTSISQTGGIDAGGVDAAADGGTIVLTDTGNAFDTLSVHTADTYNASVFDSTGVTVAASSVGGLFTLHGGGAIAQSGAVSSGGLDVATTAGDITLTNASNAFGAILVSTPGNASFTEAASVVIAGADVGGTLTLHAGTSISQTGAIDAGGVDATADNGTIVLTGVGNAFATLALHTTGAYGATIVDSTGVSLGSSAVGGTLTLTAGGAVGQSGAIAANGLAVSTTSGAIQLNNAGNSFATLSVHTTGSDNAKIVDSTAVTVAASSVGGKFTLGAGGNIGQSGAIAANGLFVATTSGDIALTNSGNSVTGLFQSSAPGDVAFYNTHTTTVGTTSVGGDYTVLSTGDVVFLSSVQTTGGAVTAVAGWDGETTNPQSFGNDGVYGNNAGTIVVGGQGASGSVAVGAQNGQTSFYAANVLIGGINGGAQLGYNGTGGGAILVRALQNVALNSVGYSAVLGNGGTGVTGNVTGDIDVRAGGELLINDTPAASSWLGNRTASGSIAGNLLLIVSDTDGNQSNALSSFVAADIVGGDVTLGFTGGGDQGPNEDIAFSSSHTLTVLTAGNFIIAGNVQNSGTGAINVVAGWDGHTLDAASFGTAGVYGNGGKGIVIGGEEASGNAAIGSAGGTTSLYGASLTLAAINGFAQLGFNGHGSGAIGVTVSGDVVLSGGNATGEFVQIGNGGRGTSGNNSGAIVIAAGGSVSLAGGTGTEAYAQIGHGGAESNSGAQQGYTNSGPITITATDVSLNAGSGNAAYVQIGNGGYKVGAGITGGTATNSGDITVTSSHVVSLNGNGSDAYAQIGNGGSQSNLNPSASAGGTDSGAVVVQAPNGSQGSVSLVAGAGPNAYAQIGNGGYSVNAGANATVANWTITGDIHVTDLLLQGNGINSYGVIGNGDAAKFSYGNVFGDIYIDTGNGTITYTDGTGPHAPGTIGNFTGHGTINGNIYGAHPPSEGGDVTTDPVVIGVSNTNTANNASPTNIVTVIQTVPITDENGQDNDHTAVTVQTDQPGPLARLDENNSENGGAHDADSATVIIADSLNGSGKPGPQTLLGGLLKSIPSSSGVHGVPPADQDFSSWGNEALWQ
ncbi:MAG: filamentous hemagglutinin N-terminal domain-containing protein [Proteobacteria bacterium]|nr:filamentous hemagglutinin N-terminal domain-containing protein [Pseudomonadota bacterium]